MSREFSHLGAWLTCPIFEYGFDFADIFESKFRTFHSLVSLTTVIFYPELYSPVEHISYLSTAPEHSAIDFALSWDCTQLWLCTNCRNLQNRLVIWIRSLLRNETHLWHSALKSGFLLMFTLEEILLFCREKKTTKVRCLSN